MEIVVAHSERTTLRVGDTFLKVDSDAARLHREVAAIELAPVPTPHVQWHHPHALALVTVLGAPLGRLGQPSTRSAAAWSAAGETVRQLHDAPLPP